MQDGADLRSAGNPYTVPGGHGTENGTPLATIADPAQADAFVRMRIAEGSDYIKFMLQNGEAYGIDAPSLSPSLLNAGVAAAHAQKRLALAHAGTANEALEAVRSHIDGLMHIWAGTSPAELIAGIAQQHLFVVPTLSVKLATSGKGQGQELTETNVRCNVGMDSVSLRFSEIRGDVGYGRPRNLLWDEHSTEDVSI